MSFIDTIAEYIPSIKQPLMKPNLQQRIKNTILVVILYSILASIPLAGISPQVSTQLENFMWVFGSSFGTLASLGVAPMVLSGIFLQLLVGMGVIDININTEEGKTKFDNYNKFLTFLFIIIESIVIMLSRNLVPISNNPIFYLLIFIQLLIGGLLIYLLDDFSYKYGITSGINIIIFTVISFALAIRLFNPLPPPNQYEYIPSGFFPLGVYELISGNSILGLGYIAAGIITILILIFVAYLQYLEIDIPVLHINIGGRSYNFPIKVLYTSVIPAIFIYSILFEIQAIGGFNPNNILVQLFSPPNLIINLSLYGLSYFDNIIHILNIILYFAIFIIGGAILSYFWVIATGMDPKTLAEQLSSLNIGLVRFRDPRVLEKTLEKYIYPTSILSGVLVGFVAALSDSLSSAISGVSLLLLVLIAMMIYQDLKNQGALHYIPIIGKYLK